jgi:hypothetical protein
MVELIINKWYECYDDEDKWIFKLENSSNKNLLNLPFSLAGTPLDGYISKNGFIGSDFKDLNFADMEEVYKLFPKEKILQFNKIYELW